MQMDIVEHTGIYCGPVPGLIYVLPDMLEGPYDPPRPADTSRASSTSRRETGRYERQL